MFDPLVILGGSFTGFVVGLTGMGGGALMTPILVMFFGVEPLAAVSSDIVASMVMKPIGGAVHWRHGTVHWRLVRWLILGSIPSAFLGVVLLRQLGSGAALQSYVKLSLAAVLLLVAAGLIVKPLIAGREPRAKGAHPLVVKPLPTLLVGIAGGLIVGLTSVGSGSLMIILLLLLYPDLKLSELVGTDLVQAVPLVASAAVGHLFFGDCHLALSASILIGSIPGIFVGARLSSRAPDYVIRPSLVVVLFVSGLKLVGAPNAALAVATPLALGVGVVYGLWDRRRARGARDGRAEGAGPIGEPSLEMSR